MFSVSLFSSSIPLLNICSYFGTDDSDPNARLKSVNKETQAVLDTLNKEYKAPEKKEVKSEKADKFNAVRSLEYFNQNVYQHLLSIHPMLKLLSAHL